MKKLTATLLSISAMLTMSQTVSAAADGFYVSGKVGQSYLSYDVSDAGLTSATSVDKKGFAGIIDLGYQFDENWAVDLAYWAVGEEDFLSMNNTTANGKLDTSAWNLSGKGILPFNNDWAVYGKAGLARATVKPDGALASTSTIFNSNKNKNVISWAIGAEYEANDNILVDFSFNRLQTRTFFKNVNLYAVGLSYHFG